MAAAIQIIVAGALLLAWIWVLGRPLVNGAMGRGGYDDLDRPFLDGGGDTGVGGLMGFRLPSFVTAWWRRPVAVRRRQMLLASMIAVFVSFFLAVALRGRFLWLFVMMLGVLTVHLAVATRIGGSMVARQRSVVVAHAKRRVRSSDDGMQIRASRVGEPFADVPDLVNQLGEEAADTHPEGVSTYVSDLIDLEWGEERRRHPAAAAAMTATEVAADSVVEDEAQPAEPEVAAEAESETEPVVDEPATETDAEEGTEKSASEPIFTRATKDNKRSRRNARPIYIESQLDDGEDYLGAQAVNHP